ncbi:MAG: arginase family protein [Ferruginibacter sp.]
MASLSILELPFNLGLIEPMAGAQPGVNQLPGWLKKYGFHSKLQPAAVYTLVAPPYSMYIDDESGVRNADAISSYAKEQATLLQKLVTQKSFVVALGGDCSILIGNTLALKQMGSFALFFLDGHTDFAWPTMSASKGAAGMDLAIVTGHAHEKLSGIHGLSPYVKEENVWCVGNRDYDERYVAAINNSKINYFNLDTLRGIGIESCCHSFLKMTEEKNLDGFWIHFDVDVLDDEIMPAVDSREKGGMNYEELKNILRILLDSDKAVGIEITILDPTLDPTGIFTNKFVDELAQVIKEKKGASKTPSL